MLDAINTVNDGASIGAAAGLGTAAAGLGAAIATGFYEVKSVYFCRFRCCYCHWFLRSQKCLFYRVEVVGNDKSLVIIIVVSYFNYES
ncbi:hypothetical protein H5410_045459 [Solanum commersonii]|uniref:Uncharacterized protein n=1 Tax=Solanum commersonii TaxID=4109 RepID=A0A9J5X9L1_SOLCO|nr:hypothetical protein H5410_045459 [Solanum commersonii]